MLLAAACSVAAPWAMGCSLAADAGALLTGDGLKLAWKAVPAPIVAGRPFAIELQVCPVDARVLRVDATMPDHRHGMNYRPSLRPLGDGRWRAEGLLWHMAGRWELQIDVDAGGRRQVLRQSVTLP